MSSVLICSGDVTTDQGHALCSTGWELAPHVPPFDISQLDPALIATMLGSGLFIMLPIWAAMVGGRAILNSIRG